jgi:hypothetical protein
MGGMYFSFTVFPKAAKLFQPRESPLNHPPPRDYGEFVKLISLDDLNVRAKNDPDGVCEVFAAVTAVAQGFHDF